MNPGIGAKLQPTPLLLKLILKNPKLIDRLKRNPMCVILRVDLFTEILYAKAMLIRNLKQNAYVLPK
jgi:hypothetical protein